MTTEKTLSARCKCGTRWGGTKTCHCSGCHHTFSGLTAFDAHRKGGECQPPTAVGLVDSGRGYECWGHPAPDDWAEGLFSAGRSPHQESEEW